MADEHEPGKVPSPDHPPEGASAEREGAEERESAAPEAPLEPPREGGAPTPGGEPPPGPIGAGEPPAAAQGPPEEPAPEAEEAQAPAAAEARAEEAPEAREGAPAGAPAEAAPPQPCYDGLEAGLSWFGAQPFEPPVPTGYVPPPREEEAAPAGAAPLTGERRQRVRDRIAARRQETEAQKRWYQRIPLGALSMLPIVIVLLFLMIFYPPWPAIPAPKEALDESLLEARPVADPQEALSRMGVKATYPRGWSVLPGDVLAMDSVQNTARVDFSVPPDLKVFEVSCEVCVLKVQPDFGVWLKFDEATAVGLTSQEHGGDIQRVRGRMRQDTGMAELRYDHRLRLRRWYGLKMIVDGSRVRYLVNGKRLQRGVPRPADLSAPTLSTFNTQLLVRNWRVKKLD